MNKIISDSCYLILSRKDKRFPTKGLTFRLTKNSPRVDRDEVAVRVSLNVPAGLFEKPTLSASISVPETAVSAPTIDADVVDNIQSIVNERLGVDLRISVVDQRPAPDPLGDALNSGDGSYRP